MGEGTLLPLQLQAIHLPPSLACCTSMIPVSSSAREPLPIYHRTSALWSGSGNRIRCPPSPSLPRSISHMERRFECNEALVAGRAGD